MRIRAAQQGTASQGGSSDVGQVTRLPIYIYIHRIYIDLSALEPRLQLNLLRDWPKLALDRELWREVASRC